MNIGRGLFRAWLMVSILWIAVVGTITYQSNSAIVSGNFGPTVLVKKSPPRTAEEISRIIDAGDTPAFYQLVISPSRDELNIEFSLLNSKTYTVANLISFPDGSTLYIPKGYNDTDRNYISQQFWRQHWSRWGEAFRIVAPYALLPCIALFIFGYVLLWIGRGFKRS